MELIMVWGTATPITKNLPISETGCVFAVAALDGAVVLRRDCRRHGDYMTSCLYCKVSVSHKDVVFEHK